MVERTDEHGNGRRPPTSKVNPVTDNQDPQPPVQSRASVNLLGQNIDYPNTWPAVTGIFVLCVSICLLVCIILYAKADAWNNLRTLVTVIRVGTDNKATVEKNQKRFGFWTPSAHTKDKFKEAEAPEREKWEVLADNTRVDAFGDRLTSSTDKVTGYRRYEVTGKGRGVVKQGWWWVLTVDKDYTVEEFVATYRDFWGAKDIIYVELTGDEGTYRK